MSGVRGGIRGEQVRDDSLTGQDINESTLILPQVYHASGNSGNTSNVTYIAIPGRNGWSTTFSKAQMQLVAPYDGKVTKVFLRPTTGDSSNTCLFQVRTNGDGNLAKEGETNVQITEAVMIAAVDEGTAELIMPTPASIPEGHAFSFAIKKGAGLGYGITDVTIIIEWDLSS
jgi:hypothetical protein